MYRARSVVLNRSMGAGRGHIEREWKTISKMVGIYCADHHRQAGQAPCKACLEFLDYAETRLQKCPYGDDKPTCSNCPIHCYKPAQRARAKEIMRYAGPRMLFRHPLLAIAHQVDGMRRVQHPRELSRAQRARRRKP